MLARLEEIEGVSHAAVDYGGNYLRLTVDERTAVAAAIALLSGLGYAPDVAARGDATPRRWYDVGSVAELSMVEADVISRRVVGTFVRTTPLPDDVADRLQAAVASALRSCFSDRDASSDVTPAQFRRDCLAAAATAARGMLDGVQEADFVGTLEADLEQDHTHDAGL